MLGEALLICTDKMFLWRNTNHTASFIQGDFIHFVEFPPFFTRGITLWLPVCLHSHQSPCEKGSTLNGENLLPFGILVPAANNLSKIEGLSRSENISEDIQEMPQLRSTTVTRHLNKEWSRTNTTRTPYETAAQAHKKKKKKKKKTSVEVPYGMLPPLGVLIHLNPSPAESEYILSLQTV